MLRNILPMNLLLILQSLNISGSALTWTIENEENSVNVNLKWTRNDCQWKRNSDSKLNVRNGAPPKRRKTPSAIKRDRERKEAYLAKRNTIPTPGSHSDFKGINSTANLPTPIISYVSEERRPLKVSTHVQTYFDNTKCIAPQTEESQFKAKCQAVAVQTELSRSESCNAASQTDFEVSSGHEVEVQTESAIDLCHQITQTEVSSILTVSTQTATSSTKPSLSFSSGTDRRLPSPRNESETSNHSELNKAEKRRVEIAKRRAIKGTLRHAPNPKHFHDLRAVAQNVLASDLFDIQIAKVQNRYDDDRRGYLIYNVVYRNGRVGKVKEDKIPPRLLEQFLSTYPKNCYEQELDTSESESEM